MGGDDEVAVVQYKDKWYCDIVFGGNAWLAIERGSEFSDYDQALLCAGSFRYTEYGICIYRNYEPTDSRFKGRKII